MSDWDKDYPDNKMKVSVEDGGPRENEWPMENLRWFVYFSKYRYKELNNVGAGNIMHT